MKLSRVSRREFLGRAGALALVGAASACTTAGNASQQPRGTTRVARGFRPKPAPTRRSLGANDRIRCGFIGVGRRATSLLQVALARPDVEVVAITDAYDIWRQRAIAWCKEERPEVGDYVRFEDMLHKESLDAVVIGAPDHIHAPAILAALGDGLDVYTEKPMTLTWQQAKTVRDLTRETGAVVQVGTQLRSTDIYQQARDIVQAGGIGHVAAVRVNRSFANGGLAAQAPPAEANADNVHWDVFLRDTRIYPFDLVRFFNWRQFAEYSNGYFGDLMLHHLDACHFITGCGMPKHIMSVGGIYVLDDGRSLPDTVSVLGEYPEKFLFEYATVSANAHYGLVERYIGSEGVIEIRDMSEMSIFKNEIEEVVKSAGLNDAGHMEDFFSCMRTRATPIASVDAGFAAATCAHMARMSQQTGESAKWYPSAEEAAI